MSPRRLAIWMFLLLAGFLPGAARAAPREKATFALIIGVNRSVDVSARMLHYADDDAAQYLGLFRALGARTYILSRFDENTARLHPQANAEAHEPRELELSRSIAALTADIAQARARHVETVLYFVYAGHGNVRDGEGYLALEDGRLDAAALEHRLIDGIGADQNHLIIDACYSYFLVYGRGAGGDRRPFAGFSKLSALASRSQIGLLLSTSSARESHEWEAFQAGVFSHEVRSGLYGAADSDHDGVVSYREIAAFVERANAAIPNERFRPDVFARPPASSPELLDLRVGLQRRIDLDESKQGHYLLEDDRGVRLAEFHSGDAVSLARPISTGSLYLRHVSDEVEYVLPAGEAVVTVASLEPSSPRSHARGAAHEAFGTIFSLPFDRQAEAAYRFRELPDPVTELRASARQQRRRIGYGLLGGGGAALLTAAGLSIAGVPLRRVDERAAQLDVIARNELIFHTEVAQAVLYGVGGAVALAGALTAFLPERARRVKAVVAPGAAAIVYEGAF